MALEKKITYDYEVRTEHKIIQQRQRTAIVEDGKEISFSYLRKSFAPDADISGESDELKALANSLWNDDVKKAYEDFKKGQKNEMV
jgi:hypothetical protein|tara:strand:- start:3749 stop:4006 length:258 start_codon:yes stop_codon:yes gene_type:complete